MPLYFPDLNSRYIKHCDDIFVNNYLLTWNTVPLYFTELNSRYVMVGIVRSNGLLIGNEMALYFTELNSRYFKHCNGIFDNHY